MSTIKQTAKKILCLTGRKYPGFNTRLLYLAKNHKMLNLGHPETFTEKLSCLKLNDYNYNPAVKACADKYRMRDYVRDKGFGGHLSTAYGFYSSADEVPWDVLPESFALKWNFWHGLNFICTDKSSINTEQTISVINAMKNAADYYATGELQYEVKDRILICEKYIPDLIDYKFYFFNGTCKAVLAARYAPDGKTRYASMYDPCNWSPLEMIKNFRYSGPLSVKRPAAFEKMLEIGSRLSDQFPFVRIDMYEDAGRPVVGEMTFTPGAGVTPSEACINGITMGDLLKI